ncbi:MULTISPECIES: NAD-dependent epimerase/dehydratase family protein [unclassified Pseudomonas]|uniref:NAD-dependent epimerase/dehydratase family protein n=1 Tax=unclassified Pseudomonas TaxID=196821 RepID=UPI0024484D83|nr:MULTISPECIES: NAD-dependent epimerase/dehydratase family protein [unclassified Pseudomonas]MDH0304887.1 NAD-dependent epimerase/dehydratase family protein [Pseudomonas sp. GD04091]MDH1988273.1 NAD-dependent epimerase/dehydratase family protein [Pseudomonas sp. GD03689]
MHVLVTGGAGFVGQAVCDRLERDAVQVTKTVRTLNDEQKAARNAVALGDIGADTDWRSVLEGIDVVVHLAARAHVLKESHAEPLVEFRRVNVDAALALAQQAAAAGVKRFVFISSIGVNGNVTGETPFAEHSRPAPHAPYAQSKLEAEEALERFTKTTSMELVIIRPPLVYAAHAPGNFRRLLQLVASGIPMPFASINNRRSMIALDNLADFITCCVRHPAAGGQTFLISDDEDLSLPGILHLLGEGMGKKVRLLPVPSSLMAAGAGLLGKKNLYTQLCCSLQVDSSKCRELLGWVPPLSASDALLATGKKYRELRG